MRGKNRSSPPPFHLTSRMPLGQAIASNKRTHGGPGGREPVSIDGPLSWQATGGRKVLISRYSLAARRWIEIKVAAHTSVL
jgi:hypothetical protein